MKENVLTLDRTKTVTESPKCLIAGHTGPCNHKWCGMAYRKPQYFGMSIAKWYERHEFLHFDVMWSTYGRPHLIPHNQGYGNNFEVFRQSQSSIVHLAGPWPSNISLVPREHVKFAWAECVEKSLEYNPQTGKNGSVKRLDVNEFAYYVGPIDGVVMEVVDVNAEYKLPFGLEFSDIHLPTTDWCHCGSVVDWCGEGCRQPHNKEFVLSLEKGASND